MMGRQNLSRRTLLTAAMAAPFMVSGCNRQSPTRFRLRLSSSFPAAHPVNKWCQVASAAIFQKTDGLVAVDCYPASQLGSDTDRIAQLRGGAIHLNAVSGGILSTLVPMAGISNIGFAFRDTARAFEAVDGALGKLVRSAIAEAGILALPKTFDNGFRQITNSTRAIETPQDLVGMKIRVPPGRLWTSMFQNLGALPATINFSETYSALQTRVVEGQENSLLIIESAKLYEVQQYCSLTNHMWDGIWLLAHPESLRSLPGEVRDVVIEEFSNAAINQRKDSAAEFAAVRKRLESLSISLNDVDPEPFVVKLRSAGFYSHWRNLFGPSAWSVLEEYAGRLA